MRVVTPIQVTPDNLTSTNVVNEESDWAAGTYSEGDRVVYENEVYEVVASSTTLRPDNGLVSDPPEWIKLGWSNQFRMFRDGRDSQSTSIESIDVTLDYGEVISTVAVLGIEANSATLVVTDPTDGVVYNETIDLVDIGVADWWEYFFLPYSSDDTAIFRDIPPYPNATIDLSIDGAAATDEVKAGRVVGGVERSLGVSNYGTSVSLLQYSTKERDGFGNLILVPRRSVRLVDYDVTVESGRIDFVVRDLERLSATPTLFIGDELYSSSVTFGVYRDFNQGITTPSVSDLTIQVEGF